MDALVDALRSLGPLSPLLVYLAATAESAGFIGLFVPGEVLTIAGGAIAGLGATPLAVVMAAAVAGAITGDSIGFWIGHRFGAGVLEHRRLRRAKPAFDRASAFLEEHRRSSLVVARFTPMIRSLIPMAAGAGGMRYRSFILPNAVGGTLWGIAASSLGFWAGARWQAIQDTVQQGMGLFALLAVAIVAGTAGMRWVARHPSRVRLALARLGDRPVIGHAVRLVVSSWGQPRPFLRLVPHTVVLVSTIAIVSVTSTVDVSFLEGRVISWLEAQISDDLTDGLEAATTLIGLPVVLGCTLAISILTIRRRTGKVVAAATTTALTISLIVARLTERDVGWVPTEWRIDGSIYPDLRSAAIVALVMAVAWPWTESWAAGTRQLSLGAALAGLLSAAAVGAQLTYPVDAVAGAGIGAVAALAALAWLDPRIRSSLHFEPTAPAQPPVAPAPVPATRHPEI